MAWTYKIIDVVTDGGNIGVTVEMVKDKTETSKKVKYYPFFNSDDLTPEKIAQYVANETAAIDKAEAKKNAMLAELNVEKTV